MPTRRLLPASSALAAIVYDDTNAVLDIEFRQGETYRYFMVPRSIVADLLAAESAGQFFIEHIRDNYSERRID